jgi:hypothetical protein
MNEQHFWTVFFATVAIWAFLDVDPLCEELDDPANCQAWHAAIDAHRERIKAVPVHTSEHPYCLMSDCPCHDGAQEEPVTDRRNEWNGYNQEMAWEAAEEEWRCATDSRDFEPDDLLHTDEHPYCDDPACWCHRCEQEIPFTDEEIEAIMSADADNKDADELEQGKHDWLSEHL